VPQVEIPVPAINGQLQAEVFDPTGVSPLNVVRNSTGFRIDCQWWIDGPLANVLGGSWRVQAFLEGRGTQVEITVPVTAPIPLDGRTGPPPNPVYGHNFQFPPGAINLGGQPAILMDAGIALTYLTVANTPGPIAGFVDLGVVQVFP
jgi:hypothetical protein